MDVDAAIDQLRESLRRYPREQYPVQHATAQFHLGVALLTAEQPGEAVSALRAAATLFDPELLPVEHAKATNMLGAALRQTGQPGAAAEAFSQAAAVFQSHDHPREHAAALFNLGLVHRESGSAEDAVGCFRDAWERFDQHRLRGQASAAARELGATLLARGDLDGATGALEQAVELASQTGDQAALGAAANALGLAHLASQRTAEAIEAFRTAALAHPRSVRAEGFAMAKANLALAYEQAGDAPRARLAARQALGTVEAPGAVRIQAADVLARLGSATDDLLVVLDQEPVERWSAIVREEVVRWVDADPAERRAVLRAWVDGVEARPGRAPELAEAWLGALLELPPPAMDTMIRSALEVVRAGADDRFRDGVSRAMVRFHVPQWMRLKDTFNQIAGELGLETSWG